jgi:hypothetical protein
MTYFQRISLHRFTATFIFALAILLSSCDSKDSNDGMEPIFDQTLLFQKKWYLHSGIIDEGGQIRPMTINSCRQDDTIEFQPENILVCYYGMNKCSNLEPDTFPKRWHFINNQLELDNIVYDILTLSSDSLNLKRKVIFGLGVQGSFEYLYKN